MHNLEAMRALLPIRADEVLYCMQDDDRFRLTENRDSQERSWEIRLQYHTLRKYSNTIDR